MNLINLGSSFNVPDYNNMMEGINTVIDMSSFPKSMGSGCEDASYILSTELKKYVNKLNDNISNNQCYLFLNNNNRSHEISAILSAFCFNKLGRNDTRIILNFDYHPDNEGSCDNEIKFLNWGNCVNIQMYNDIAKGSVIKYKYVKGIKKNSIKNEIDAIFKEIEGKFDLYISIDTDFYKGSCTYYGDGNLEFCELLDAINHIKTNYSNTYHICGADITGLPDKTHGKFGVLDGRKCLSSLGEIGRNKIVNEACAKIKRLEDILLKMFT